MTAASDLVSDDKLLQPAIAACPSDPGSLRAALQSAASPSQRAAVALVAGRDEACAAAMRGELVALLDNEGIDGRAAAWALRTVPCQEELLDLIAAGGIDQRTNAWMALAHRAATLATDQQLADRVVAAIDAEMERVASGRTGLGEMGCRVLVALGDPRAADQIQRVIENDRFCDRFELQRLLKRTQEEDGQEQERSQLGDDWTTVFADDLVDASMTAEPFEAEPEPAPGDELQEPLPTDEAEEAMGAEDAEGTGIDWEDFLASPEAGHIQQEYLGLLAQIGPAFEQMAAQALGKSLSELSDREVAALFLQVHDFHGGHLHPRRAIGQAEQVIRRPAHRGLLVG
ncbi:MAG: hypothetical protein ACOCXA_05205 [Planctomycetota bacterium]